MLKKFTDFTIDRKNEGVSNTKQDSAAVTKPKTEPTIDRIGKIASAPVHKEESTKTETKKIKKVETNESIVFEGKIVQFPTNTKMSSAYKLLENKKVSKEKLHYIIAEANKTTLIVAKYNENANIKLLEFMQTLLDVYSKKGLKEQFSSIKLDGNDTYCIIMGIPEKAVTLINKDLVKLLSK